MNKTIIIIAVTIFAGLALAGSTLILVFRPDASATFIQNLVMIGGLLTTTVTTFIALDKVKEQTAAIAKSVNGNTTKLINAVRQADAQSDKEPLMTAGELAAIEAQNAKLLP